MGEDHKFYFVKKIFDTALGGEFMMSNSLKELIQNFDFFEYGFEYQFDFLF
jgi:hypothetical protein